MHLIEIAIVEKVLMGSFTQEIPASQIVPPPGCAPQCCSIWVDLKCLNVGPNKSPLSCQKRRFTDPSQAKRVLPESQRSGDWETWRATAQEQRAKTTLWWVTGEEKPLTCRAFGWHCSPICCSVAVSLVILSFLILSLSSSLKLGRWGFWCLWRWRGRGRHTEW